MKVPGNSCKKIIMKMCEHAYVIIADPVVRMLPSAERCRQGVVGSLLVLFFKRPAPRWHSLLVWGLVGGTGLVQGGPDRVIFGLLCPELSVASAVWMSAAGGIEVV